ncbi:MAG: divalent-cation tolerance protein CutA [Candidatus Bathyarchaeia archaeon]|nr:divalent-cation tolerance protein CutA [Candidatus Bathyarchaeota archaeon]
MYVLVLVSCPDEGEAARIGRIAVENRLAACATVVPRTRSIYRWKGRIEEADEALLMVKTREELFRRLEKLVVENHPYSIPEIISLRIGEGHTPYLEWIREET